MNRGLAVSAALCPLSLIYGSAVWTRNFLYDQGLLMVHRAGIPVISVGNLAAGGTGKTPFVIMLAKMLLGSGHRVSVVSRGYRRLKPSGDPLLVSDGKSIRCTLSESGDEPFLTARSLLGASGKGAMVIVCADRPQASSMARSLGAEVIILDDGFQHRRLHRDLDIVLLDARKPLDNGLMLPAGMLREGPGSLRRADAVVLTRAEGEGIATRLEKWLKPNTPVFFSRHVPRPLIAIGDWRSGKRAGNQVEGRALLFSGIAKPESFEASVRGCGLEVARHLRYPDHHHYSQVDLESIAKASRGLDAVVTTEKDAVRLPPDWDLEGRLLVLGVDLELIPEGAAGQLDKMIKDRVFPK